MSIIGSLIPELTNQSINVRISNSDNQTSLCYNLSHMKYFFALGNHPELSQAELFAVFQVEKIKYTEIFYCPSILVIETKQEIKSDFLKKIGGSIKFGIIEKTIKQKSEIPDNIITLIPVEKNKIFFGISQYNFKSLDIKKIGFDLKTNLKQSNITSRFVSGKENPLSSVIVQKNKLLSDNGLEIILINDDEQQIHLGKTLAVQDFREYSKFDFGRPGRDDFSGMLPPKVAQIMINLAQISKQDALLDPFCGSGTVVQMAATLGYTNLWASDISEKALADTKQNFDWLQLPVKPKLGIMSATELSEYLPPNSIDAIVTEPYLGHPLKGNESPQHLTKVINELSDLYNKSLEEFKKILKPQGIIIMIIPEFVIREKSYQCQINIKPQQTWRYAREGQRVIRHIWKIKI